MHGEMHEMRFSPAALRGLSPCADFASSLPPAIRSGGPASEPQSVPGGPGSPRAFLRSLDPLGFSPVSLMSWIHPAALQPVQIALKSTPARPANLSWSLTHWLSHPSPPLPNGAFSHAIYTSFLFVSPLTSSNPVSPPPVIQWNDCCPSQQ